MKTCNDELLLFLNNLTSLLYAFVWTNTEEDYSFYKSEITFLTNYIFSYKKKLLENYLRHEKFKEGEK